MGDRTGGRNKIRNGELINKAWTKEKAKKTKKKQKTTDMVKGKEWSR